MMSIDWFVVYVLTIAFGLFAWSLGLAGKDENARERREGQGREASK